jgi:uroporphyrinogen III methyltransferase/synthase
VVAITRAKHQSKEMLELVEKLGGTPYEVPLIEIIPSPDDELVKFIDEVIEERFDLLIFLSTNSVRCLFQEAQRNEVNDNLIEGINKNQVLAIGARTLDELRLHGVTEAKAASIQITNGILRSLGDDLAGLWIGIPRSSQADNKLGDALRSRGAHVREVTAYISQIPSEKAQIVRFLNDLGAGKVHAVTFTSASTARNLFTVAMEHSMANELRAILTSVKIAAIGPKTKNALESLGVNVDVVPESYSLKALMKALVKMLSSR